MKKSGKRPVTFYRCRCGYEFELPLGKYGCPSCEGTHTATIVMEGEPWP